MALRSHVDIVSKHRALSAVILAALGVAFNYGTTVTTVGDAVLFFAVSVSIGYPLFTLFGLLSSRFWTDE